VIRGAALCLALLSAGCATPRYASASPSLGTTSSPLPAISSEWEGYHGGAARTGVGPSEPPLGRPSLAWNIGVDGEVYASPLIVSGHVIVATENNTVYSMDVFTGASVWTRHLGDPVDSSTLPCGNISPTSGITGTPAADPATGRVYVVAYMRSHHHVLFALSLVDGSIKWQQDIDPPGSDPSAQQLRGALAIGSGFVYVPFGGLFGDCGSYRGYVVGVPLAGGQARVFAVPASRGASIWAPSGPTIGPDGSVYVVTGNGLGSGFGYSDSALQLSPDLQTIRSYFAPSNWQQLNAGDVDLGSAGATVITGLDRVLIIGKEGVLYLLQQGKLGGIGGQIATLKLCGGSYGGTAWAGSAVFVPCTDGLYAVTVSSSSLTVAWRVGRPADASPILTAGAVWAIEAAAGTLYALDPATGKVMFSMHIGTAHRFSTPAATDGFVVVAAGTRIVAVSVAG
jgi:outer membrane protein assembly factor BamB